MNDYDYEIIESNGYLNYDNSLLDDDVLSFRPYHMEQNDLSLVVVELNTMRFMADRPTLLYRDGESYGTESVQYQSDQLFENVCYGRELS